MNRLSAIGLAAQLRSSMPQVIKDEMRIETRKRADGDRWYVAIYQCDSLLVILYNQPQVNAFLRGASLGLTLDTGI